MVGDLGDIDRSCAATSWPGWKRSTPAAPTGNRRASSCWSRTFGHVVIDEAQDLSPMQLRMIGRRVPSGSMTIVGDLGQASGPWAPGSWDDVVAHLPPPPTGPPAGPSSPSTTARPSEVMDIAARVLAVAAPELSPSRSVRRAGVDPVFTAIDPAEGGLFHADAFDQAVLEAARAEREAVPDGKVAVITSPSMLDRVRASLCAGLRHRGRARRCSTPPWRWCRCSRPRAWSSTRWSWWNRPHRGRAPPRLPGPLPGPDPHHPPPAGGVVGAPAPRPRPPAAGGRALSDREHTDPVP